MLTIRALLTPTLFILSTLPARAQWQDYIVTLKNDTIYGDLQFRFSMPSTLETEQDSYPVDIKSVDSWFSASHKTLARRRVLPGKKKYIFLPVLESGAINATTCLVESEAWPEAARGPPYWTPTERWLLP